MSGPIHYLNPGDMPPSNPRYFKNNPPYPNGSLTGVNYSQQNSLPPLGDAAAQQAYSDYIRRLDQDYQNRAMAIQNQLAQQRMAEQMASLGLNFQGDTINQNLGLGRAQENIASLNARRQQQMQSGQLDLARNAFNINQNKLDMQDNLARQQAQRAQSEVTPGYEIARKIIGGAY